MTPRPIAFLVIAAACSADPVREPESSSVLLEVQNRSELAVSAPLRYAVVFTYAGGMEHTDGPLGLGAAIEVPLVTPGSGWEGDVTPIESAVLPSLSSLQVYRPRILVYEDIDWSASFLPNYVVGGVDRVLAIDTSSAGALVGVVIELDATLARLSLEETEAYYAASGDRYTPFVRVLGGRGTLQLESAARAGPLRLNLSDSPIPLQHLLCGRDPVYLYGQPLDPATRVVAVIESSIYPLAGCFTTIASCLSHDLASLPRPNLTTVDTEGNRRVVQCRANDRYEAVVIHQATMRCADCLCSYEAGVETYVAPAGAVPPWWPCGDTMIKYCDSAAPLYQVDPACVKEPRAGG